MQEPWDVCVCAVRASVRIRRVCVCTHACLWTHLLLPCRCSWGAGMWALGQGDHRLSGPQLSLCPLPFLAAKEAKEQSPPSDGQLRLKTTGLRGPPPCFPKPTVHPPAPPASHRPPARPAIRRGFTEPPPGASPVGQATSGQRTKK